MKGGDTMKKLMSIIVSILFAFSLTGLCFAQAPPLSADKDAMSQPAPKADKKKVKKAKKAKKAKKEKKAEKKAEEPAPAPEKK
jgi:hypothetical protein